MKTISCIIISGGFFLFSNCTLDKAPVLNPVKLSDCDTVGAISYSTQIVPIINSYCISCHNAANSVPLNNYAAVHAKAVIPYGSIYGSVAWDGTAANMPQSAPKLSSCDISKIKKWVEQGALNN